jgi:sec-independent protein translocase protein TatC
MQEYWATFREHLDDLRTTLVRSFLIIGVGFLCALTFSHPILKFFAAYSIELTETGLIKHRIQRVQVINQTTEEQNFDLPAGSWLVSGLFRPRMKEESQTYRIAPGQALIYEGAADPLLILSPIEGLVLVFKLCFWLSVALTAPFWGWVWLQFILPGLKEKERMILFPFLLCSLGCLALGVAVAYKVTLPISNHYLFLFNNSIGQNAWTLSHYVNYVLLLCLGHAIAAELALLLLILVHFRFLSPAWLIDKRRYMIVLAFIIGALLTPPDVLTQVMLAIPLIALYELAILYAKWIDRPANQPRRS